MSISSNEGKPLKASTAKRRAIEIVETLRACSYSCDPEMRRLPLRLVPELRAILDWHDLTTDKLGSSDVEIADILHGIPGRTTSVESYGFGSPPEFDFAEVPVSPPTALTETSVVRAVPYRASVGGSSRDSQTRREIAAILDGGDSAETDDYIESLLSTG